jgi:hypothetical protein
MGTEVSHYWRRRSDGTHAMSIIKEHKKAKPYDLKFGKK